MDTFSTYPFQTLFNDAPVNVWGKETPTVGHDVWIASDVVIYSGVHIGDGAVIGGNSVVTKPVPPYAIVAGNPAKIIGSRSNDLRYKSRYFPFFDTDIQ
jgi:acetyltransferase-like isoleucine patch superfamily enzyme